MSYIQEYEKWIESEILTGAEHTELLEIKDDEVEIKSRFYAPLSFGTAGLRGVMGMGLNRMNIYVVRQVTQAMAELVLGENRASEGVAIAYDSRINSELFAREAARVLAANGIKTLIFDALRPTPELSFAILHYGCAGGINITASHNPKEYNGYKAYWADGAQLPPEHAEKVERAIEGIDIFTGAKLCDFDEAATDGRIQLLGAETDELFLSHVLAESIDLGPVKRCGDKFSLVYTPFHGAGYKMVPEALKRAGFKNICCVEEQMVIDGSFPTVASPNPENPEGFALAIALAKEKDATVIIGTDPDGDRVGAVVRTGDDEYTVLSGNETGSLLLDYIISARLRAGSMPQSPFAVKTIVSSELPRAICEKNGVEIYDTFTGFKFIAEKINALGKEGKKCIFSYEESFGYLFGDFCRDKDAVTASLLLAEMAAYYFERGMTLADALQEVYSKYGFYADKTINVVMPGIDGIEKMAELMRSLRSGGISFPEGMQPEIVTDYLDGTKTEIAAGEVRNIELSGSNVLGYEFKDGVRLMVRPSGTEPKIKFYILSGAPTQAKAEAKRDILAEFCGQFGA